MTHQFDNKALIKRCQNGSSDAFAALLEQQYDAIFAIAFRWCNDRHNAQDITQQACLKLSASIHQFQFKSSFSTWLYRLVINCAKDFYKSPTQHNQREQSNEQLHETTSNASGDQNAQRIYAQQILHTINELQEDLKSAIILVYVQGLNHAQAAELLGIKESTVSWRIHKARKNLKQIFQTSSFSKHGDGQKTNADNAVRGTL